MATLSLTSVCSIADAVTASPSTTVACVGTVVNRYGVITNRAAYEICHLSSVIANQTSTAESIEMSLESSVFSVCEALSCVNAEVSTSFSTAETALEEAFTRIKDISVLLSYIARAMDFAEASAETWLSNVELACSLSVPSLYPGTCAITCSCSWNDSYLMPYPPVANLKGYFLEEGLTPPNVGDPIPSGMSSSSTINLFYVSGGYITFIQADVATNPLWTFNGTGPFLGTYGSVGELPTPGGDSFARIGNDIYRFQTGTWGVYAPLLTPISCN